MDGAPIWVFVGPSMPPAVRPASDAFTWLPPAIAGDGFAALEAQPAAVVLIDGLFDHYPAIRHKELLALMESGVPVIGGASMGALRAAELHTLGMIGVGPIFEAYASGRIVGDDEVAVLHGPADMDWAPLTIPLVNVRATLVRAVRDGVIPVGAARRLRTRAAGIFYQDRTWRSLMAAASAAQDATRGELDRFAAWVERGYVDLKQLDALQCLETALALPPRRDAPGPPGRSTVFTDALAAQVSSGRKPNLAFS
jgi:hypothetical protein